MWKCVYIVGGGGGWLRRGSVVVEVSCVLGVCIYRLLQSRTELDYVNAGSSGNTLNTMDLQTSCKYTGLDHKRQQGGVATNG